MTDLYADALDRGPSALRDVDLVGIILDDTYEFDADHATFAALAAAEVAGAGYERPTATGRVERIGESWKFFIDDMTGVDLSDVADRGGIAWGLGTPVDDDIDVLTVGWAADPGGAIDPYLPTWDSGFAEFPIASVNDRLAAFEARTVAGVAAVSGNYPAGAVAAALEEFLPVGSGSGDRILAHAILGVADVDGTATTFKILQPSPGSPADGVIPEGFVSVFTVPDVATFEAMLEMQGLTTATVVVPDRVPAFRFSIDSIGQPWTEVTGATAAVAAEGELVWLGAAGTGSWLTLHPWSTAAGDKVVSTGDPGVTVDSADDGVTINSADDGVTIDSADDGVTIRSSDPNVTIDADDVEFVGSGLMYGTTQAGPALRYVEGKLDGHRDVSTAFTDPVTDLATLMSGPVDDIDQPTGIDGRQVQKGDFVATLGDVDVDGQGWIKVVDIDTGQWGDVPSNGPSTPVGASAWDNALTTNYLRGGDKIVLDSGAIGTFRAYRTNGVDTWVRGGPAVFSAPAVDGEWVFTAAGFDHADVVAAHAAIEAATDHAELVTATAAAFALVAGITP